VFGRKSKLQGRLERGELRQAQAAVLQSHFLGSTSAINIGDGSPGEYRVHVRIEAPGEDPFEASLNVNASHLGLVPHEGGTLPVAYDPVDHDAVIWDEQTARTASASAHAHDRERRERIAAEHRAAGLPPVGDGGPDPELTARIAELNARHQHGELNDWEFRVARAEVFKDAGF
jgi:hypothetical protein